MKMKVAIINVPENKNVEGENGCSPALGCVRVANAAKVAGADAVFIEGQHYPTIDETLGQFPEKIEIVGISFNRISVSNVRSLISRLFKKGVKKIIAGGQAVIPIADLFVKDFSDSRIMACTGDGEPTIQGLVQQKPLGGIPNLAYFDGAQVKRTIAELMDYKSINLGERVDDFDWKKYFAYSQNFFGHNRASAYFTDGCPRRMGKNHGCSFCARRLTGAIRSVDPKQAYTHLRYLKKIGAEQVSINDDTFFGNPNFLKGLAEECKNQGSLNLKLHVYGCASELTPRKLDLAKSIGVGSVLVGIESGNELVRRINGKPISDKVVYNAGYLCKERGISYDAALIIGLIGETAKTAEDTVKMAKELSKEGVGSNVYASLFMPYAGSWAYDKIKEVLSVNSTLGGKYNDQFSRWDYDWSILIDAQLEINTALSRAQACAYLEEIRKINEDAGINPIIADYSSKNKEIA